jgi:hypothetical protein
MFANKLLCCPWRDNIPWLDCGSIFARDEWVERASRKLEEFSVVHFFHERHALPNYCGTQGCQKRRAEYHMKRDSGPRGI